MLIFRFPPFMARGNVHRAPEQEGRGALSLGHRGGAHAQLRHGLGLSQIGQAPQVQEAKLRLDRESWQTLPGENGGKSWKVMENLQETIKRNRIKQIQPPVFRHRRCKVA